MDDEEDYYDAEDQGSAAPVAVASPPIAPTTPPTPGALPAQWWIAPPAEPRPDATKISAITELFNRVPPAEAIKTVEMAMQLEGVLGFEADVKAGTPTLDAMKKWAPKMYFKHPAAVAAMNKPLPAPFSPTTMSMGGHKLIQTSPNRFQIAPNIPPAEAGPLEARPIRTPDGKTLGYAVPGKGGAMHPIKDVPVYDNVKPADMIRAYTAQLKAIEKQIESAENNRDTASISRLMNRHESILNEMAGITGKRAAPVTAAAGGGGIRIKDKKSNKVMRYRGNPSDVPTDRYEILKD